MPLIEREKKTEAVPLAVSIEKDIHDLLTSYCDFLDSSKRYVVEHLLMYAMVKDKDFQKHMESLPKVSEKAPGKVPLVLPEKKGA
jgi:hypothetical protein